MGNHTRDAVGVDISKAHLDVHRLNTGEAAQFGNDAARHDRGRGARSLGGCAFDMSISLSMWGSRSS